VLVKYGANTSLLNSKGKKPEGNSTEISEILKSKPEIQSMILKIFENDVCKVRMLLFLEMD
jgi:hypothetical protein